MAPMMKWLQIFFIEFLLFLVLFFIIILLFIMIYSVYCSISSFNEWHISRQVDPRNQKFCACPSSHRAVTITDVRLFQSVNIIGLLAWLLC